MALCDSWRLKDWSAPVKAKKRMEGARKTPRYMWMSRTVLRRAAEVFVPVAGVLRVAVEDIFLFSMRLGDRQRIFSD